MGSRNAYRASTWGDLHRERRVLMVTNPDGSRRDIKNQALRRAARCMRCGSLLDNETRPGQSSAAQVQDAGLVRILCVAREGAYENFA